MECRSCERSFLCPPPPKPAPPKIERVSRIWLWGAAWVIVLVVMLIDAPGSWRSFWNFPFYSPPAFVLALIYKPKVVGSAIWLTTIAVGWLYYAVLTAIGLGCTHYKLFFRMLVTLGVSLTLNCLLWLLTLYFV
jgi:hypothetical protein